VAALTAMSSSRSATVPGSPPRNAKMLGGCPARADPVARAGVMCLPGASQPGAAEGAVTGTAAAGDVADIATAFPPRLSSASAGSMVGGVLQPAISAYTGTPAALASAARASTTMPRPFPGSSPACSAA
jgi:hypothetical protein